MLGILCEKPSAAKNFAAALNGKVGNYNGTDYKIVNALGHIYALASPDKQVPANLQAKYSSWNLNNLPWNENDFSWKRIKNPNLPANFYSDLQSELSVCDEIAIATDVDPSGEGQLLAWEIIEELNLSHKKISRFYFTDESASSIQKAFVSRKVIPSMMQDTEYLKAIYRSKFDFLTMQFTRIAKAYTGLALRQGRLKSAMIVMVGDQLKKVSEYKKIPFYQAKFKDENGITYTNPNEQQYKTKEEVPIQNYHDSDVVVDSKQMKSQAPPKLIDLATLSAKLAPKGFKPKQILDTYQKMYEAQVVSYPRTEDKVITPEQFNDMLPLVDKIAAVVGVDVSILTHRTPRSTHVKTGGAHGANRPGPKVPNSLNDLSQFGAGAAEIYDILAKSYLAMLCEDYEFEAQKGHIKDFPKFVGTAAVPKKMGYKLIWQDDVDDDEEDTSKGLGTHGVPFVHEGFSPKPANPTMKWLMKELEKKDIGTGATRTSTYADVTADSKTHIPLLKDSKGKITFAEGGEKSYLILPNTNIGSLELTKEVFDNMKLISDGKAQPEDFLPKVAQMVMEDIEIMAENAKNADIVVIQKAEAVYKPTGETISFKETWSGHTFTDEEKQKLLNGEEISFTAISAKTGKEFNAKGKLAKQSYKGKEFWGFELDTSGFGDGIPDVWCGHKFTAQEKDDLRAGKMIAILDAVSKAGKQFACNMTAKKQKDGRYKLDVKFC